MASDTLIERLHAGGIVHPKVTVAEAQRAGLRLAVACAMLEKETAGGHNVFGHDPTIFVGAGQVTKAKYQAYKQRRVASGNKTMQGVGPCQLTWYEFQDEADREGGCWRPEINIRIGFRRLAANIKLHGEAEGAKRYNGTGKAADLYSADLLRKAAVWEQRLAGVVPANDGHPAQNGTAPLRRGDRGPAVAKLSRRLSRLKSAKTGSAYLDGPRREFDAALDAALKAFQADHRLVADGIFGPRSQRRLMRALNLQKAKPAPPPATTSARRPVVSAHPAAAAKPRVSLRALVNALQRHDAETGQTWDAIVHFAGRRSKLREHRQAVALSREPALSSAIAEGFAAVTTQLKEIDGSIDTLLAMEKAEEPVAVVEPVPVPAPAAKPTRRKVVEATAPVELVNEGPAPPSPVAVPPTPGPARRQLTELSDDELLERIEHLDRAIDRARTVLIRRYAEVEKDLAVLAPPKKEAAAAKPVVRRRPQTKRPTTMSPDQLKALQSALNAFSGKRLKNVAPIVVDGVKGKATVKRIREAKNYLGYTGKERNSAQIDKEFIQRLKHPRSARHSNPRMLARALRRRRKQKKAAKLSLAPRSGVATFDGRPVAAWMQPYLVWARENGWKGTLNSGWRDPAHSEHLCLQMCGRPSCPGKCAGRSSNHAGSIKPAGAVDVSDYVTFGHLMTRCPYSPKLVNRLGARDPVHYSVSGG
jgi:peptidoglycan hydrolase-like protein with peptidoglycan-binding domain